MDEFVIDGGVPLRGTVTPSGNKNAAFPLIAAALLTDEPVRLYNLPDIADVRTMLALVERLGVEVDRHDPHTVSLRARRITTTTPDPALLRRVRGGLVLMGPLLAREGEARVERSGGDQIGRRRIDTHVLGLQALGAVMRQDDGLVLRGRPLRGADILLDEASVTATENVVLAATLAEGTTVLRNAACEPHVQETCQLLTAMGARIDGIGSNLLRIHGVARLRGAEFTLGPDFMEVGSFVALAAVTGGEIIVKNAGLEHLRMALGVFGRLGVRTRADGDDLILPAGQSLAVRPDLGNAIPTIDDGPWPAFPADLVRPGEPAMHDNAYRVRAEHGDVQLGTWVTMIRTPAVLTLLKAAGLDFARVDMEHSPFSMETVADMATLARALDFPLVVRPPEGNREWITRLLDAGVWNLHVPQVDTPEQAAAVAACCRYAPLGERGMYGFGPHTMYQTLAPGEHMAAANARVRVTAMLETKRAFDRLDAIASVPGIDALTIGPTDLAQDLGVLGTPAQRETLDQYRRRLVEAARKHGKAVAMLTDSVEGVRQMVALGATIINYSSDAAVLRAGYAAIAAEVRRGPRG